MSDTTIFLHKILLSVTDYNVGEKAGVPCFIVKNGCVQNLPVN